jgi:hypothetical protein
MKPSAGRIVLYWFANLTSGTLECRPAIVTSVDDEHTVNLHVFFEPDDKEDEPPTTDPADHFRASISKNEGAADTVADVQSWDWPPRV